MDKNTLRSQRFLLRRVLRQLRREKDIRQEDLAERLGVVQSYVSKYESGDRKLDLIEVRLICRALGVSLSEVLRRFEEQVERCNQTPPLSD